MFQTSAGHQAAGPQDPVSTGVGGHAGPAGESRFELSAGEDVYIVATRVSHLFFFLNGLQHLFFGVLKTHMHHAGYQRYFVDGV